MSDTIGELNRDTKHNELREGLKSQAKSAKSSSKHIVAGLKGLGYGLFGGLTSIVTQTYQGAKDDGVEV